MRFVSAPACRLIIGGILQPLVATWAFVFPDFARSISPSALVLDCSDSLIVRISTRRLHRNYEESTFIFNSFIHSIIHSDHFYSASSSPLLLRSALDTAMDSVQEFHAEALQATATEGFAQGSHVVSRAGFEPMTLRLKDVVSTNVQPSLTL